MKWYNFLKSKIFAENKKKHRVPICYFFWNVYIKNLTQKEKNIEFAYPTIRYYNKLKEQLEKLREVAEASLTKTDELQKVLAQIEALMSREESQTLSKKK